MPPPIPPTGSAASGATSGNVPPPPASSSGRPATTVSGTATPSVPRPAASATLQAAVGAGKPNASVSDNTLVQQYLFHMGYLTADQVTGRIGTAPSDPTLAAIRLLQADLVAAWRAGNHTIGIDPSVFGSSGTPDGIISRNGTTFSRMKAALAANFRNPHITAPTPAEGNPAPAEGTGTAAPRADGNPPTTGAGAPSPIIEGIQRRLVEMGYLRPDHITGVIGTNDGEPRSDDLTILALREWSDNTGVDLGENMMPNQRNLTDLNASATATPPHRNPEPSWTMASVAGRPFAYYDSSEAFLTGIGVRSTHLFGIRAIELGGVYQGGVECSNGDVASGVGHIMSGIVQTPLSLLSVGLEVVDRGLQYLENHGPRGLKFIWSVLRFFVGIALFFANIISAVGQIAGVILYGLFWCLVKPFELLFKAIFPTRTPAEEARRAHQERLEAIQAELRAELARTPVNTTKVNEIMARLQAEIAAGDGTAAPAVTATPTSAVPADTATVPPPASPATGPGTAPPPAARRPGTAVRRTGTGR